MTRDEAEVADAVEVLLTGNYGLGNICTMRRSLAWETLRFLWTAHGQCLLGIDENHAEAAGLLLDGWLPGGLAGDGTQRGLCRQEEDSNNEPVESVMSEFKIGDRVEVFGHYPVPGLEADFSGKGSVTQVDGGDLRMTYRVRFDGVETAWWVYSGNIRFVDEQVLAPGDLVELKSHSAPMTVVSVVGESVSIVYTQYGGNGFMDSGPRIVERTFPLATLKKVEAK